VIASVASGRRAASEYVRAMVDAERAYAASNSAFVSAPFYTNHDTARSASYYPSDDGRVTKMAYAMSLLMPGDSFVYYGEELGMEGSGKDENKRAPMYWSDDATAQGMCAAPDGMDAITMRFPSLEEQMTDEQSLWSWFKQVIAVRKAYPAIARGRTETVDGVSDEGVAAFVRKSDGEQTVLVVMNLRDQPAEKDLSVVSGELALAEGLATDGSVVAYADGLLSLPAYSIAVLTVAGA
jgi:glycosidase